jgi:hypothetical protein
LAGEQAEMSAHPPQIIDEPVTSPPSEPEKTPVTAAQMENDVILAERTPEEPSRPAKKGWWQRTFRSEG